jgi:hypothetical protein
MSMSAIARWHSQHAHDTACGGSGNGARVGAAESTDVPGGKNCRSLPVPRRPANSCVVPVENDCFDKRGLHATDGSSMARG